MALIDSLLNYLMVDEYITAFTVEYAMITCLVLLKKDEVQDSAIDLCCYKYQYSERQHKWGQSNVFRY